MNFRRIRTISVSTTIAVLAVLFGNYNFANADMGGKNSVSAPCTSKGNAIAQAASIKNSKKQVYCNTSTPNLIFVYAQYGISWDDANMLATSLGAQSTGFAPNSSLSIPTGVYANWYSGEPNGFGGEPCVHTLNGSLFQWNDLPCGAPKFGFLMRYN